MNEDEEQMELIPAEETAVVERHEHQDQDYEYVRNNLQDIIETGSVAL